MFMDAAEGELVSDQAAKRGVDQLVLHLTTESKRVRAEIDEIERTAPLVADLDLRREARTKIVQLRWKLYEIVAAATHGRYTALDVKEWVDHALGKGAVFPSLDVKVIRDLAHVRRVPNAPLREAVLNHLEEAEDGFPVLISTAHERLVELEAEHGEDYGSSAWCAVEDDEESVKAAVRGLRFQLGMAIRSESGGRLSCAFLIPYERAVAISQAIGMHPQQAGV
jgi:hypothetical protein